MAKEGALTYNSSSSCGAPGRNIPARRFAENTNSFPDNYGAVLRVQTPSIGRGALAAE
jgi:hypothetical protein